MKSAIKKNEKPSGRVKSRKKKDEEHDRLVNELQSKNEALQKSQSFLSAINAFSADLLDANEISDVLWLIAHSVVEKFDFEDCVVYILEEESFSLKKVASHNSKKKLDRKVQNEITIPIGVGIVGTVAETGRPELINDTRKDSRYILDEVLRLSELTVPIINDGELIGVIDSEHSKSNFYSNQHLETLVGIANLSSAKIKNLILAQKELYSSKVLKESEATNKTILNNALDAVISSSLDGNIIFWNPQAESIFGWSEEEALGKKLSDLIIPVELRERHEAGMKHYLQSGEATVLNKRIEITALRKDLSVFPVELAITPIKVNGKMTFNAFIRDITERKRDEHLLKQQNNELERINTELDRFVYRVTHDLKAPLSNMYGLTSLAKLETDQNKLPEYHDMMESSIAQMRDFIDDLISYARNANAEIKSENVDLEHLLAEIINNHRFMENSDRIVFDINVKGKKGVQTDSSRLRIILSNLVSNAIKYHDFSKKRCFVKIETTSTAKDTVITVCDNGLGMDIDHVDKIFEMFYRVNSSRSSISGSGIGLYILRETLNKLKGEISVESVKAQGTTFTISLPCNSSAN